MYLHCLNNEPEECADQLENMFSNMADAGDYWLSRQYWIISRHLGLKIFYYRLESNNIGQIRYGVEVWDGTRIQSLDSEMLCFVITGTILAIGLMNQYLWKWVISLLFLWNYVRL